jgi:amidase
MRQISEKNTGFFFDPAIPPVLTVESGEIVEFMTKDCYDGQIDIDNKDFFLLDMSRNNPITGPLYIKGAEPGDTLKVEVLNIVPNEYGMMCVRLGKGVYHVNGNHCRIYRIKNGVIQFDQGIRIPFRPMIGIIGTCPTTSCDTHSPGPHGGNLDIRDLGIGSTVYLPVYVPGAMLSIGDCHALQGDGETAICGLEVSAAVTVRVTILKEQLPTPLLETQDAIYTISWNQSLDQASLDASRKMHHYLMSFFCLSDVQEVHILFCKLHAFFLHREVISVPCSQSVHLYSFSPVLFV